MATTNVGLRQQAEQSLPQWIEPCLGCDLLGAGAVRDLRIDGSRPHLRLDAGSQLPGELPLGMRIRQGVDNGVPVVAAEPNGALAQAYQGIARRAVARLSLREQQAVTALPVVVEARSTRLRWALNRRVSGNFRLTCCLVPRRASNQP